MTDRKERDLLIVLSGPLEASMREEQDMATWIDSHVEDVALQYLA